MRRIPQMLEERPNPVDLRVRKMWAAVLIQAIDDLKGVSDWGDYNSVHTRRLRRESAAAWFTSRNSSLGSFNWVCELLRVDPGKIRDRLFNESTFTGKAAAKALDRREHPLLTLR